MYELEDVFPNLNSGNYTKTSPPDRDYNCIAWAAGDGPDERRIWWPDEYSYWPSGVPRELNAERFIQAFETLGYSECTNGVLEPEYEKVALYVKDSVPTHMARQLEDGTWTSKLGNGDDITHTSLHALEDSIYGEVHRYLKRPK